MAARGGWRGAGDGGGEGRTFGTPTRVEQQQQQQRAGKNWNGTRGGDARACGDGAGAEGRPAGSRRGGALYAPRGGCGTAVASPSAARGAAGPAGAARAPAADRRRPAAPRYPLPPSVAAAVRWRGVTAPRGDGRGAVSTRGGANISSVWLGSSLALEYRTVSYQHQHLFLVRSGAWLCTGPAKPRLVYHEVASGKWTTLSLECLELNWCHQALGETGFREFQIVSDVGERTGSIPAACHTHVALCCWEN